MKRQKARQVFPGTILVALLMVCAMSFPVVADVVGIGSINVVPPQPTDLDTIEITTQGVIGYIFDISFVGSDYHISGTSIDLDFYFFNANPGGMGLPVAGGWESTENIGTLSQATYNVTASAWINENLTFPNYRLADTYSASFTVVPEPATLVLLGLGGLRLRRNRGINKK